MAEPFNARKARSKRPCPLWVDAFHRDTQHLEADEIGSYLLILMTMWSRETCDYPDDDRKLALICRVSMRLWKSRIGLALRPFFASFNGMLISNRLREEADYVERQVQKQSDRKKGENPDNPLGGNSLPSSADDTADEPRAAPRFNPSQQPNYPTVSKNLPPPPSFPTSARAAPLPVVVVDQSSSFRERLLVAMGHDPTGMTATGKIVGSPGDMLEAGRWQRDLGFDEATILDVVKHVCATKRDGPPTNFAYFTKAMARHAAALKANPLAPSSAHTTPPAKRGWAPPKPFKIEPPRDKRATPEGMKAIEEMVAELRQKAAAKGTKR